MNSTKPIPHQFGSSSGYRGYNFLHDLHYEPNDPINEDESNESSVSETGVAFGYWSLIPSTTYKKKITDRTSENQRHQGYKYIFHR